jgi:hypothetical protein
LFMHWLAGRRGFTTLPLTLLLGAAVLIGGIAGVGVLGIFVVTSLRDSWSLAFSWAEAGAVAGAVTLVLTCLVYRYVPQKG